LHEPQEVLISTEKYQNDNDIYRKFYADKIEKVQNVDEAKKTILKLQNVFSLFREWYKEEYPSYRDTIGKGTFKNELCKKMGVIRNPEDVYGFDDKKHGWVGYREIQQDNEELSFEDN
jgi:protein involved in sex pheromone biosynthesis